MKIIGATWAALRKFFISTHTPMKKKTPYDINKAKINLNATVFSRGINLVASRLAF